MPRLLKLILCIALPMIVGGISGFVTVTEIPGWYTTLQKPSFNPPNYLFGPVWTTLYLAMGISLYLILSAKDANKRNALLAFTLQLVLNFLWSIFFFKFHNVGLALADILLLWPCILAMIAFFYKLNKAAGLLQIPYLLWVTFASVLNASIFILN